MSQLYQKTSIIFMLTVRIREFRIESSWSATKKKKKKRKKHIDLLHLQTIFLDLNLIQAFAPRRTRHKLYKMTVLSSLNLLCEVMLFCCNNLFSVILNCNRYVCEMLMRFHRIGIFDRILLLQFLHIRAAVPIMEVVISVYILFYFSSLHSLPFRIH